MTAFSVGALSLFLFLVACTEHNPRACINGQCTSLEFPFCDVDGAVEGVPNACIPVSCTPLEFETCRDSTEIRCNATGDNFQVTECEAVCDPAGGCGEGRVPFIVFVSDRDGNPEVYRMNPDGSLPTNLTRDSADDTTPIWDPTGERIAFLSTRSNVQELYTMKPDGSDVVNVSAGEAAEPAWSSDGTRLAFTSSRMGQPEIFTTSATSATSVPLTTLGVASTSHPSWSPDGTTITFQSGGKINVVQVNGGATMPITAGSPRGDLSPTWDPTGTKIAFERGVSFEDHDIVVINADGGGAVDVTSPSATTVDSNAQWSPDGAFVVGEAFQGNTGDPLFKYSLFVVEPDGLGFHTIALPVARAPCWSPDGVSVAYQAETATGLQIMITPREGGSATNLTDSESNNTQCSWRPR